MSDRFMTPKQAEERYSISRNTLAYWRMKNVGPKYHKIGKGVRYKVSDFEEWMETQVILTRDYPKASNF